MSEHIYALTISSNIGGQFAASTLHWKFEDSGFGTTNLAATALISAWDAAARTAWRSIHPTDMTMLSIRARQVNGVGGFESILNLTTSVAGTRSGTCSAAALSPCIVGYGHSDSPKRSRTFLHGVSEADVVDGIFTTAFQTAVATAITSIYGTLSLTGGGGPSAVFVIYNAPTKLGVLVDHFMLSDLLGTIRRRQRPV